MKKQLPDPFYNVRVVNYLLGTKLFGTQRRGGGYGGDTEASLFNMRKINNAFGKCICFSLSELPQQGFIVI